MSVNAVMADSLISPPRTNFSEMAEKKKKGPSELDSKLAEAVKAAEEAEAKATAAKDD